VAIAAVLAASLLSPMIALADDGRSGDRPPPRPAPQAQDARARAEQARQAQLRQEQLRQQQAKAAQERAAQARAAQEKAARERAQAQAQKDAAAKLRAALESLNRANDNDDNTSDHPSGKDRNAEPGKSFPQGRSPSNPDGGALDKPGGMQGDVDGNNGCGNDNDFADDNNGNCGGRKPAARRVEVAGIQVSPIAKHQAEHAKDQKDQAKSDQRDKREDVRGAVDEHKVADAHNDNNHEKVGVCHATGSASNPFVFIEVSNQGWTNGHEKHGDDIRANSASECPKAAQNAEVAGARVEREGARHLTLLERLKKHLHDLAALIARNHQTEVAGVQTEADRTPTPTPTATSTPKPTQTSQAKAITDHECVSTEWHWVVTQVDSKEAAEKIQVRVTWANGQSETLSLSDYTGQTAHFRTTSNLNVAVTSAVIVGSLPSGWTGQFNLSHGPCF